MSLTLLVWLSLFAILAVLAFIRPAWGVSLYMLTVFLCPPFWWWGDPIAPYRWNWYSGWILLAAVIASRLTSSTQPESLDPQQSRRIRWLAIAIVINATIVHIVLADSWEVSGPVYTYLLKFILLFFLISASVRNETDYRIILLSILLGAAYIGYEVTVNDRGRIQGTRLEGVGMPNAATANGLASLMVTVLPLTGTFFLVGRKWEKALMLPTAPFIVNVLLLCNSRGAFLASLTTAVAFLISAPPGVRRKAFKVVALGCVVVWMLLGDARIVERFWTTFADPEQRDSSAADRLDYWKAGLRMVGDYPLGAGGDGFHTTHGPKYIAQISGAKFEQRSIHNGYINEACDWGIQGFLLKMGFIGVAASLLWRSSRQCIRRGDDVGALYGSGMFAGLVGFLITCFFGDFLDNEWAYWMVALAVVYARLYANRITEGPVARSSSHTVRHQDVTPALARQVV